MGQVISEGLDYIGRIDDNGNVFDGSGECVAQIDDSGYIRKNAGFGIYGKIDEDGTIRDSSLDVVGRIEANGYVYIHSKRVCHVTSAFLERITPKAWTGGQPSSYSGRTGNTKPPVTMPSVEGKWPFSIGTTIKLLVGVGLGIACIATSASSLGFWGCLLAIPFCIVVVFVISFIIKVINGH